MAKYEFDTYTLDPDNLVLERLGQPIALRRSCFDLLVFLVNNRHRVVRKDEINLSDQALKTSIKDIRSAFASGGTGQEYIKTRHRIGYQFVEPVREQMPAEPANAADSPMRAPFQTPPAQMIVGRDDELEALARFHARSLGGNRTIVFVPGEPGIGKTACIDTFLEHVASIEDTLVLRGQCVETHGAEEAFMPWMGAIEQLGRLSTQELGIKLIDKQAPSWLAHMPWLKHDEVFTGQHPMVQRGNRVRMMRELAVALETASAKRPIVLALEDLHWSDPSTLDALSFFARRRFPARVLILCTYRSSTYGPGTPRISSLHQELALDEACTTLDIPLLSRASVTEHVTQQYPGLPSRFCNELHRTTDGNPLFLVCLLSHLASRGFIHREAQGCTLRLPAGTTLEDVSPDSVHDVVTGLFERLEPLEQALIEVASVTGVEFSSRLVAASLEVDFELGEETCESLARRRQFIQAKGRHEWPDGSVVHFYEFTHSLIRNVVLRRVTATRRQKLHARIADQLEQVYKDHTADIASELAGHFEAAKLWPKCVSYSRVAARNALRRSAPAEAGRHLKRALRTLKRLPKDGARDHAELEILAELAPTVSALEGYASSEARGVYLRAEELAEALGEETLEFDLSRARLGLEFLQGNLKDSKKIGEGLVAMASTESRRPLLKAEACARLGTVLLHQGKIRAALALFAGGLERHRIEDHLEHAVRLGHDPVVINLLYTGWAYWAAGKTVQARSALDDAVGLVRELDHPITTCVGLGLVALVEHLLDDPGVAQTLATCSATAEEHGMVHWQAVADILMAWLRVEKDTSRAQATEQLSALHDLRHATAQYESSGAILLLPYYLALQSRAELLVGKRIDARMTVQRALHIVSGTGENWCLPELTRIQAEIDYHAAASRDVGSKDMVDVKQTIQKSIRAAKRLGIRQWEIRSAHTLKTFAERAH